MPNDSAAAAERSPVTVTTPGYSDIRAGDWIDRWLPAPLRPYLRLARLDRPIGTWLLLFPGWWSLTLASGGRPDWTLIALFGIGAVLMRGAGCTINDILDRDLDAQVERTRVRPLPSGQVSLKQAIGFLLFQLLVSFVILLCLSPLAIGLGVLSLLLVFSYPLMKRITWWPQAFLGLTFNWGALMGWAAATNELAWPAALLYVGGIAWTLGYDTIYAHQDKEDDVRIGVKSSALALGERTRPWTVVFYTVTWVLFVAAGMLAGLGHAFIVVMGLAALQLAWQVATMNIDDQADCLVKFKSNRWFAWLVLGAILAGTWLPV